MIVTKVRRPRGVCQHSTRRFPARGTCTRSRITAPSALGRCGNCGAPMVVDPSDPSGNKWVCSAGC